MVAKTIEWKGGKDLIRILEALSGKLQNGSVQVGFFENSRYTDTHPIRKTKRKPLPVAQVAFWNEFGTRYARARPFFRSAITASSTYWGKDIADLTKTHGFDTKKVLTLMGESIKDDVQHSIATWSQPPNRPYTVKVKGFNAPLKDDGTMQREVGYQVNIK